MTGEVAGAHEQRCVSHRRLGVAISAFFTARRGVSAPPDHIAYPPNAAIRASVPLAEMFGYATDLRSMTQGRATFTMQFDRYEEVPVTIAETIVTSDKTG